MKYVLLVIVLFVVLVTGVYISNRAPAEILGSLPSGQSYLATTTAATVTYTSTIKTQPGTLGSIVITTAGTGTIDLYDATTTTAHPNHATTSLASFSASAPAGTYTLDVSFIRGLVVQYTAFAGKATITYR